METAAVDQLIVEGFLMEVLKILEVKHFYMPQGWCTNSALEAFDLSYVTALKHLRENMH